MIYKLSYPIIYKHNFINKCVVLTYSNIKDFAKQRYNTPYACNVI